MNYIVFRQQNKGIPSILALALVAIFGIGIIFVAQHRAQLQVDVAPTSDVQLERNAVGNIRDNTVTFYWRTSEDTKGYIMTGLDKNNIAEKIFDNTDTEQEINSKRDHVISLNNLSPHTTYYYYIMVDGKRVGQSEGQPFQIQTTDNINTLFSQKPIFGRIFTATRHVIPQATMIVTVNGSEPLITMTKSDGSYSLSPCCLKKGSSSEVVTPKNDEKVMVEVTDKDSIHTQEYDYG